MTHDHPQLPNYPTMEQFSAAVASRRSLLKAGAAALGLGAVGFGSIARAATDSATPAATATAACVLTPELTEGPYYVADELIRKDITEGKPGVPLNLRINVVNATGCAPLANAAVDIWHCDANGYYSGISGENPGDPDSSPTGDENLNTTFLRGVQLTGEDGIAEFLTIYPGWYRGRDIHIHMKVHVNGAEAAVATPTADAETGTYSGGAVAHTGQLFFDEDLSDEIAKLAPYSSRNSARTRLEEDMVYQGHDGEAGFFLNLSALVDGQLEQGMLGEITVGIDPTAVQAENGLGGGQGGPGQGSQTGGPPPTN
jgi:protocatechuate 3,4-dioxygenase beta subunit